MPSLTPAEIDEYRQLKAEQIVRDAGVQPEQLVTATRAELQQRAVISLIHKKYDIIRVEDGDILYCVESNTPHTLVRLSDSTLLKSIIKEAYDILHIIWTDKKLRDTADTLKASVPLSNTVKHIDTTLIEVCPGHFWDMQTQQFTDAPIRPCFVRLFDNGDMPVSQSIVAVDFNAIDYEKILLSYRSASGWLESTDTLPTGQDVESYDPDGPEGQLLTPPVNIYFPFIDTWACHNHDTYMDIMKMIASVFMRRKPLGTFILTGVSRNGKGTCAKMIHTLLGRANTSSVRLDELGDEHKNLTLATTLFNAPDEDVETTDMSKTDIANFKSMASNEPLLLKVMYSAKPQWVSTDFVSLSPMNASPVWKGTHATACMKRSLVIGFHADLSRFDNKGGKSFEEETFTPDMFASLIGTILALSKYYNEHNLTFSETMDADRQILADESLSVNEYASLFVKYFNSYQRIKDVYNDYAMWAHDRGLHTEKLKTLKFAIQEAGKGIELKSHRDAHGDVLKVYGLRSSTGKYLFALDTHIWEAGDVATVGGMLYGSFGPQTNDRYVEFDGAQASVVSFLEKSDGSR